jgi:hypothetical protein
VTVTHQPNPPYSFSTSSINNINNNMVAIFEPRPATRRRRRCSVNFNRVGCGIGDESTFE